MRRLSSPSRRFKRYKISPKSIWMALAPISVASLFWACRSREIANPQLDPQSSVSSTPSGAAGDSSLVVVEPERGFSTWMPLKDGSSISDPIVAWMDGKSCFDSTLHIKARVKVLGFETDVEFEQGWNSSDTVLAVDPMSASKGSKILWHGVLVPETQKGALCEDVRKGAAPVSISNGVAAVLKAGIQQSLVATVGDCKSAEWGLTSWHCKLPGMMPQAAIVELEQFQQAMIRKWSRQPYILARRAGVATSLAKVATRISSDEPLRQKFCKMIQFSLPEELPLILTSNRWQKSMCEGPDNERRETVYYGLAKAIDELAMLRQLYESTSRVGVFALKIPDHDIPSRSVEAFPKSMRITIVPQVEVTDRLVQAAENYLGTSRKGKSEIATPVSTHVSERRTACWHPIFGDTGDLMSVASGMRLTGALENTTECIRAEAHNESADRGVLARYLLQSLSSETEFVMENGQSKLLRLPEGQYSYMIQVLPQNPIDTEEVMDESSAQTRGALGWGQSKTHSIRSW